MTKLLRPLLLSATLAALAPLAAGCGDDASTDATATVVHTQRTAAQDTPPASLVSGALGGIADTSGTRERIGYVAPQRLAELEQATGVDLTAETVTRLVLGKAGSADLRAATPAPETAVRVGDASGATVLTAAGERTVRGATGSAADALAATTPAISSIAAETPSAVQSCLGDPAAEVIVGPTVLGRMASAGVSILTSGDAPAGAKLVVCLAPHYARELHAAEDRLKAAFPAKGAAAGRAPVVAEQEIGEREIVGASVPLERVDPALVRELLAGGPALLDLARG